ncbi:MAG: acetate--CoA ligase family protein [Deltaproteobacteria bacterium]|nr:acetate--CoA ligase family protein [Deltaproteobacteria bacterium]
MARLYEHQSKKLLAQGGLTIPRGRVAASPEEAAEIAVELGGPVVVKAQAWVTGRASAGGVRFADDPPAAREAAAAIIGMQLKNFTVQEVLVEERLDLAREMYVGLIIDDTLKCPRLIFSSLGGTGIEEIAREHPDQVVQTPVDITQGLWEYQARDLLCRLDIRGELQGKLTKALVAFYRVCRRHEARSAEINPLVLTADGRVLAADCHMAIDDYAVFRHPDLGIDIAREFDRPATPLEKAAYQVEAGDHRGTFYFLQMAENYPAGSRHVGFHGAGGGGSMMSMDALLRQGFHIANFCDTSGNPSASKVYRAARIILSQPNLDAYFASGSGVASQEQYHSARGLVKAFREVNLSLPAVIRIGGNSERQAMEILAAGTADLPGRVEAFGRDTSAVHCAGRLVELVDGWDYQAAPPPPPAPRPPEDAYSFDTITGSLHIDHAACLACANQPCVAACPAGVLRLEDGRPVLALSPADVRRGRCTECLACELACQFEGRGALFIELPIPGLPASPGQGE